MTQNKILQKRFLLQIAALLVIAGMVFILFNRWSDQSALEAATLARARAHVRDILLTRRWNSSFGGVYVEKRDGVESSPYVKDPDISASNGKTYTLRVPAHMTREISALAEGEGDYRFRLTGIYLKNLDNAPDAWERNALLAFAQGEKERFESIDRGDRTEFRYMAPLFMEQSCRQCHDMLDYKVGDVRGGISVRFDITSVLAAQRDHLALTALAILLISATAFMLASIFSRRLDRRLHRLGQRHEDLVQSIDGIVWEAEPSPLRFTFVSQQAETLFGYPVSDWLQAGFWATRLHPDDREMAISAVADCATRKTPADIEYRLMAQDGKFIWIHDRINVVADDDQSLVLRGLATDITIRRQHDEQVQNLLSEKESILENALVGIVHFRHRCVVACNRRFEEIFGYGPGELIGESTRRLYDSEATFVDLGARAYAALGRGSNYTEEVLLRRKDGRIFWGAMTGRAINPSQPQEGSIWIYADISERRQAEEEVHKLLRAVEQSPVSIVITNRDGIIEYINPRFTRVTGYTIDEAVGQNPRLLQSGETPAETYRELWRTVLAGNEWRGILRNRRKNGELFWEEATISPIVNERREITHLLAVKEDISERKNVENALRDSHEAYLHLLSTTLDGFLLADAEGNVLDVNAAYIRQSGYDHEELLTLRIDDLEADQAPIDTSDRLHHIVAARGDQFESVHRRKDGSLWDVEVSVSYRASAGGQFFVFLRDISARKQIQRQLEDQQQHLEELVQRRTADLAAALQAATVADKAKDAFLANVSHELRTPLNAVIGFSGLALRSASDAKQSETLKKIMASGQTLLDLVNDLLDLSKISAGEMRFETMPFRLRDIVARVLSATTVRASEKSLRLSECIDDDLPDVLIGDPLRVEQILLNLVSNAIKFTANGAVQLRIDLDARAEKLLRLRIEVEDTGIGMTEPEIARLFQPFAQADASITRVHGGTGLGLAICKQLAEGMNGSIEVSSRAGVGSIFCVRLWLGITDGASIDYLATNPAANLPDRYANAQVLVVDDQPLNCEVVVELLGTAGIVPQLASNGAEALERILTGGPQAFDLVLMDIQMPVMDGLTATREIRAAPGFADLPIVAMTAHTMVHEKTAYLAAGMSDHLGKPFTTTRFFQMLARWLSHKATLPLATTPAADVLGPSATVSNAVFAGERLRAIHGLDPDAAVERFSGNWNRYCHWLNVFVEEASGILGQLRDALAASDRSLARQTAHSLKGRSGMLGMGELFAVSAGLEAAIRSGDETSIDLSTLADAVETMKSDLQSALAICSPMTGATPAVEPESERPTGPPPASILALIQLLDAADGSSVAAIDQCLAELGNTEWSPLLRAAHGHVQRFEFQAARRMFPDHDTATCTAVTI